MLNIFLLVLFFILLIIHRFLTVFWEQGNMPYNFGFTLFYQLFTLSTLILFIHLWGWGIGIVLTLLVVFQVVFLVYCRLPLFIILKLYAKPEKFEFGDYGMRIKYDKTAWILQNAWSNLVPLYFILTVISLFTSKYLSGFDILGFIKISDVIFWTAVYCGVSQIIITFAAKNEQSK